MLRIFYDCLDLTEAGSEGWFVIHSLVSSMSYENVPMQDTGVSWVLRTAEKGMLVGMGAPTIWDALQHAVRGALFHEQDRLCLRHHLGLDTKHPDLGVPSQVTAFSNMLAVGACAKMLLPLAIEAGVYIGVNGFDTRDEYKRLSKRQYVRAIPELYVTWCKTLPRVFETMDVLVAAELELLLHRLGLDRDGFSARIQEATAPELQSRKDDTEYRCSECRTSYTNFGLGIVQPRKISFEECRKKEHKLVCQCVEYLRALGVSPEPSFPTEGGEWEGAEEEIHSGTIDPLDRLCQEFDKCHVDDSSKPPFQLTILTLYRAQGRRWLGTYDPTEQLCGICFFKREQYLGPDGSAKAPRRYTPVPDYFVAASSRATASTF